MEVCRIEFKAKRGGNPDVTIEVQGIKITLKDLSNEQRYKFGSLLYGGLSWVELPCDLDTEQFERNLLYRQEL